MNSWDTWNCHVCGEERPDSCISVFKRTRELPGGGTVTENIRFCNDRQPCIQLAPRTTHLKQKSDANPMPEFRSHGYELGVAVGFVGLLGIVLILWWLLL